LGCVARDSRYEWVRQVCPISSQLTITKFAEIAELYYDAYDPVLV